MFNQTITFITQELSDGLFSIATLHHPDAGYSYVYARQMGNGEWEHIWGRDTSMNSTGESFKTLEDCIADFKELQTV